MRNGKLRIKPKIAQLAENHWNNKQYVILKK